jgi:hypothetical protein
VRKRSWLCRERNYKKGSFTGATQDKEGLLAAADGDTLFLDEIRDVNRDLQRLLIKALAEERYLPLGDDRPRKSNFRLLTATNLEPGELRRRLDPLDRIGLLTLRLPPLREIREELGWLWAGPSRAGHGGDDHGADVTVHLVGRDDDAPRGALRHSRRPMSAIAEPVLHVSHECIEVRESCEPLH